VDEQGLIKDAQHGDLDAFNRLVLAHQDRLFNQAYRMLGEDAAAADVTQDAFLAAYHKLHTYRGGSFRAWLLRITTNLCYDELRRRKRHPTTALEPLDDDDQEIESPRWLVDSADTPEQAAERAELWRAIQRCLNHLSPDFKAALVLVDVQGMDYQEACESLGCAIGTLKSRLSRARLNVRTCLSAVTELLPARFRLGREGI